ncbi:hypothetical protein ACIFOE_03740 [Paenibacillus sp. NRS-1783]|uniref:hypothetical protein n=1 Tax=Paenibacillus sp. NRS-1783 TaxID=3233907 RepID=UPI003D29E184
MNPTSIYDVFKNCAEAIDNDVLIERENRNDKEFHFQNWFKDRLQSTSYNSEDGGRNSYPDFRLVQLTEGYEVKGLAYPGRELNYDCNSQIPTGLHNGRTIYYVFGRYPARPDGNQYPVLDFVLCHGDFLNADHEYVHKNKSVRGFGTYGDIMIRDRKMYVAPTPFGLAEGLAHYKTLILPEAYQVNENFQRVGTLVRTETENVIVKYSFDLRNNELIAETCPNPNAGKQHRFYAYRLASDSNQTVSMRSAIEYEVSGDEDIE